MPLPCSAALREKILREDVLPCVTALFEGVPHTRSVIFAVAQFWNDEAHDAVHGHLYPTLVEDPVWEACLEDGDAGIGLNRWDDDDHLDVWLSTNSNREMVVAFASFTRIVGDQCADDLDNYTPYAIFRRSDSGEITMEVVGTMLRPEWEDPHRTAWWSPEEEEEWAQEEQEDEGAGGAR